jgi:2-oxoglutarate ferredoxin oxidoreductase subunit beta
LTKKEISADHPTWCPGCGDFSILALYFRLIQQRGLHHEKITTVAGIGCSSRFPYFVQANGVHFIHGRALPFATGRVRCRGPIFILLSSVVTEMPFLLVATT